MIKLTADWIYPVTSPPIQEGVIVLNDKGEILSIDQREAHDWASLSIHRGILVPGFINAHCHLELSHLKGVVGTGTTLLPFLKSVVQFRDVPQGEIDAAIARADLEMYENGIVAVGDISNKADTVNTKMESPIRYRSFIEMFDFLQEGLAQETYERARQTYEAYGDLERSYVPHAPYTVSKKLFRLISKANKPASVISIQYQRHQFRA